MKKLPIRHSVKIPAAFLSAFVLLVFTEGLSRTCGPYIRSFSDNMTIYKRRLLENPQQKTFDGIFIGDSRIMGIDAKLVSQIVSQETGKKWEFYNFSLPNHGIQGHYLFLKKYLQRHKKPKVIFFSSVPVGFTGRWNLCKPDAAIFTEQMHRFLLMYSLPESYEALSMGDWMRIIPIQLERLSFLVSYRRHIRSFLQDIPDKMLQPNVESLVAGKNGGFYFKARPFQEYDVPNALGSLWAAPFIVDEQALFWYQKFFALAKEHRIKVFFFNAPMPPSFKQTTQDDQRSYQDILADLVNEFDQLTLIEPLLSIYDWEYFYDFSHLNRNGSYRFTQELGHTLAKHLQGM
jgi:hypothetical protein